MRDVARKSADVVKHLQAENRYTNCRREELRDATNKIKAEIDLRVGFFDSADEYNSLIKNRQNDIHGKWNCDYSPIQSHPTASSDDVNTLCKESSSAKDTFWDMCTHRENRKDTSPDGLLEAFFRPHKTTSDNPESGTLYIVKEEPPSFINILGATGHFVWGSDSSEIFYLHRTGRAGPVSLRRRTVSTDEYGCLHSDESCVLQEEDPNFSMHMCKSNSKRLLLIRSSSETSDETHFLDLSSSCRTPVLVTARTPGHKCTIEHAPGDNLYILSNKNGCENFQILKAPMSYPRKWKPFLPHNPSIRITNIVPFEKFLIVKGWSFGYSQLYVLPLHRPENMFRILDTMEEPHHVSIASGADFHGSSIFYLYESLVLPLLIIEKNVLQGPMGFFKPIQRHFVTEYNSKKYITSRTAARSSDGTMIPISLLYHANFLKCSKRPMVLQVYGSYGHEPPTMFLEDRLPLLDRGVAFAFPSVRGGGAYGPKWHEAGKLLNQKNTFEDTIACAKHLINIHFADKDGIVLQGASAGGLPVGALLNTCPELFCAAIAESPFVDVLNTINDPANPQREKDLKEWGNPDTNKYHNYIRSYCPYFNVSNREYPPILCRVFYNDPIVNYWEGAKWVAKIRKESTSSNEVLLEVVWKKGHRFCEVEEHSFRIAWILDKLGLDVNQVLGDKIAASRKVEGNGNHGDNYSGAFKRATGLM